MWPSEAVLDELEGEGRVVFRYRDNPNGSMRDIAGISSANGRVVGLMPHPEHATEALTGPSDDGLGHVLLRAGRGAGRLTARVRPRGVMRLCAATDRRGPRR